VIVFTHVPKTSGTSFTAALVEPNLAPAEIFAYGGARHFLRNRGSESSFVWGHVPFGVHLLTRRQVRYITFLRDPVDRAVSHYYFVKDSDPAVYVHPARAEADALTLIEFFQRRKNQNLQARFLAGFQYHYLYPRLDSGRFERATLRQAQDNLAGRYACFGLQERFEDSLDLFQRRLGWRQRATAGRAKATGRRPRLADLDPATRSALRDANRLDCALYNSACALFERRLQALDRAAAPEAGAG
jgi:hypothetical protein